MKKILLALSLAAVGIFQAAGTEIALNAGEQVKVLEAINHALRPRGDVKVENVYSTHEMTIEGMPDKFTIETVFIAPDKLKRTVKQNGAAFSTDIFDGENAHLIDAAGNKTQLTPEMAKLQKAMATMVNPARKLEDSLSEVKVFDAKDNWLVRGKVNGYRCDFKVDKKNSLPMENTWTIPSDLGPVKIITKFSDYKDVGGIMVPTRQDGVLGAGFVTVVTLKEYKINQNGLSIQ